MINSKKTEHTYRNINFEIHKFTSGRVSGKYTYDFILPNGYPCCGPCKLQFFNKKSHAVAMSEIFIDRYYKKEVKT